MPASFREIWPALAPVDREVVTILSAIFERISTLELSRLLNKLSIQPPPGTDRYDHAGTNKIAQRLFEAGLLDDYNKQGWRISDEYSEDIMRLAGNRPDFSYLLNELRRELPYKTYWQPTSKWAMMRELRIAYYLRNEGSFERLLNETAVYYAADAEQGYFTKPLFNGFDPEWVDQLPSRWQLINIEKEYQRLLREGRNAADLISYIEQSDYARSGIWGPVRDMLLHLYLLRGEWPKFMLWQEMETIPWRRQGYEMIYSIVRGSEGDNQLLERWEAVTRGRQKERSGEDVKRPADLTGLLYCCGLLQRFGLKSSEHIRSYVERIDYLPPHLDQAVAAMTAFVCFLRNDEDGFRNLIDRPDMRRSLPGHLFFGLTIAWAEYDLKPDQLDRLEFDRNLAQENGYRWVEMELTYALAVCHPDQNLRRIYRTHAEQLGDKLGAKTLTDALPRIEAWERALEMLANLSKPKGKGKSGKAEKRSRLVWFVDFNGKELEPREQTLGKSGSWSKGRKVALKRIKAGELTGMVQQDIAVSQLIDVSNKGGYYNQEVFELDYEKAIPILVGHPHLFLADNPAVSVELDARDPQLLVEEGEEKLEIRFAQEFSEPGVRVVKETPTRYLVLNITEEHAEIRRQIGSVLSVPKRARHWVREVTRGLSKVVNVQSTLAGTIEDVDATGADSRIYVHLLPTGESFKIEFFVKPLPGQLQYFKPGKGQHKVITEVDGRRIMAERSQAEEIRRADEVIAACPTLQKIVYRDYEWQLDEVEDCLSVLLELQPLRAEEKIVLEHPKGEKIRLLGTADFGDLTLGVQQERGWFNVEGELRVDDQQVINFRELMERMADEESSSRFIRLSDGEYVALTEQLRRKLREMEGVLSATKDDLQLHPLAAGLFDDIADQLGSFESDMAWRESLQRLDSSQRISARVPSTFRAELRPYQMDGFRWLSRLAEWGVGACLADDMGLGKTVQALAMILARAEEGPALVVAPASVTRNWLREAHKFTPTLNPVLLGPGDRAEMIKAAKPYDILLVSYGLLPFEGENLAAREFGVIILDEAQAIKNRTTKRSKVAMELRGKFKVVTTGTPIENHLGELWNLFNFLNPGLLGTYQRFTDKYMNPISRNNDNERRAQLRRLIQPFILRRRKEEVLEELPAKTEVNLTVELSTGERAFYEALRQQALDEIDRAEGPNKRFQVLAQLTKLRQAACHPALVDSKVQLDSSKLALVAETIKELREGNHKALIFSQFVKHLRLVEEWVKAEGIPYQYLDGSTPGPKRDEAVQAFQRGEGDVFLISLKAGGTGLTLTAADYVLHLDPWWNPAVEDQASDRAHRIGQQRPVTVYRFVTENTIEEKIVALHQEKRDLADSLLSGTEMSASLSSDQLLSLIKAG